MPKTAPFEAHYRRDDDWRDTGFIESVWAQTLSKTLEEADEIEPLHVGYGQGTFVVVKANRP